MDFELKFYVLKLIMNCGEFESALADYIDGTAGQTERAALDLHAASCSGCLEFMHEAMGAASFLKRVEEVEPPAELVTRIAFQAPQGRARAPFQKQGFLSGFASKWLQPILQPRLVMGMAMTVLSFAMLERCTGIRVQRLQPADINPVKVWSSMEEKAVRLKDRWVKNYENLRVVYEIETRLRDLQQQQGEASGQDRTPAKEHSAAQEQRGGKK